MDFLNTLTAWQWALLLAIPPAIVALYFLKLRRQPVEVPSTYLWRKSIDDLHVNSLWQRIRQNLLLYLQLLLIALVLLALLRPGWQSGQLAGERHIFLIDNSASMSATDVSPSRLEEAKRRAIALIDEMDSGEKGMVISFSDSARVEQGFTDNRRELRAAVESIRPTNHPTVLDEALQAAAGLANPGRTAKAGDDGIIEGQKTQAFILSDGKFPPVRGISLGGLQPTFVPIGNPGCKNLAITAFAVRRNEEHQERLQAFGTVENFGDQEAESTIELLKDGNPIDASRVKIAPGESRGVKFDLRDVEPGVLEAHLVQSDVLTQDNSAWAAVSSSRRPKVLLVTPGNEPLELALKTSGAVELADVSTAAPASLATKKYEQAADTGIYDLVIYDRCQPQKMPMANTLFIGAAPPRAGEESDTGGATGNAAVRLSKKPAAPTAGGSWSLGESVSYPQIIDMDRTHPLMQWLDLGDVDIAEARAVTTPPGGKRLLESNKGTLLAMSVRDGYEDAVLGFEIYGVDSAGQSYLNTNWPIRRSFPSFVYAVLGYFGGQDSTRSGGNVKPGQPVSLKNNAGSDQLEIRTPSGQMVPVPRQKQGSFSFNATDEMGPYLVREGDRVVERFTVNLFDAPESNVRLAEDPTIQIDDVSVAGATGREPVRRETWKWLLVGALVVLLVEWYIYNRRVYF